MRFVAFVTKGLEAVATREIERTLPGVAGIQPATKRVVFGTDAPVAALASLRTVDDLGVLVDEFSNVADAADVLDRVNAIDFRAARDYVASTREVGDEFSVTATLLGLKAITAPELAERLAERIRARYGWRYLAMERSSFDIRVFVERTEGCVAVRLTRQPLGDRPYKARSKPGSLRPTVAAALVQIVAPPVTPAAAPLRVVDNFCGSGTILCEAALAGHHVSGGDIDPESVEIARENLARLDRHGVGQVKLLDATKSTWPAASFDAAISNPPWGKQVPAASLTKLYDRSMEEYARVLRPGGVACILASKPELLLKYARKHFGDAATSTTRVSFTGQSPTIVVVRKHGHRGG